MVDVGLREFISECLQSLELQPGQPLLGNAVEAIDALQALGSTASPTVLPAALCWEPTRAELKRLRRRVGRVVVAGRPWRWQDWPMPRSKEKEMAEMEMCKDLRAAGFHLTALRVATYHCEISSKKWMRLLANMYSKEELQGFGEDVDRPEEYLHFDDRLLLLIAELPTDWSCCTRRAKRLRVEKAPLPWSLRLALDGFWGPVVPLTSQEAAEALRKLDQHAQQVAGGMAEDLVGEQRFKVHLLYPWAHQLVCHPVILAAVCQALGTENVLVWFSEVNAKGPRSPCHAAPHQDGIFASLAPNDAVITVWIALTDAFAEMGGLYFHRGSHLRGALPHHVDPEAENLIGFRVEGEAEEEAVPVELKAGEASLHTFRTLHWSGPNLTASRRVGLAVRYVRADVRRSRQLRRRESALVACGRYDPQLGVFDVHLKLLNILTPWRGNGRTTGQMKLRQFPPPLPTSSHAEAAGPGKTDGSTLTFAKPSPPPPKLATTSKPPEKRAGSSSEDYSDEESSELKPRVKRKRKGSEADEKPGQRVSRLSRHTRVRASCMQED